MTITTDMLARIAVVVLAVIIAIVVAVEVTKGDNPSSTTPTTGSTTPTPQ